MLRLSVEKERMGETESIFIFDLLKAIEIKLSDKAFELGMPEEVGSDFFLHRLGVQNINVFFGVIPGDDVVIVLVLTK